MNTRAIERLMTRAAEYSQAVKDRPDSPHTVSWAFAATLLTGEARYLASEDLQAADRYCELMETIAKGIPKDTKPDDPAAQVCIYCGKPDPHECDHVIRDEKPDAPEVDAL